VYRRSPPTRWLAFALAMVAGTLLAVGKVVGGVIATALAVVVFWLAQRGDDEGGHDGLYPY